MIFEMLSIVGSIFLVVLSVLFFKEKQKTEINYLASKNLLDKEVLTLHDEISAYQTEATQEIQRVTSTSESNREELEKVISTNEKKLKDFRNAVEIERQALIQQIVSVNRDFRRYASDTEIDRAELKKSFAEDIKTLNDKILSQTSFIQELHADNEDLRKKLSYFTEIKSDSTQLTEEIDLDEEKRRVEEAILNIETLPQNIPSDQTDELQTEPEQAPIGIDGNAADDPVIEPVLNASILDPDQSRAVSSMENTNGNYFITGKAGTGKSFLLRVFENVTSKKALKVSPTGISALNIGGTTIHSAFGYNNLEKLDLDEINLDNIQLRQNKRFVLQEIDTLIVDEISMVRADTFDKMDRILRVLNNNNVVFGGKQVIAFGDLFQLPPIASSTEERYLREKYGGVFFFNSDAYNEANFGFIELSTNHRQNQDQYFFEMLNRIREGSVENSDITSINERVVRDDADLRRIVRLFPKKVAAEHVNNLELSKIPALEYIFEAKVIYQTHNNQQITLARIEKNFPISYRLKLKLGALVMLVQNDPGHRWVNGTLAIVSSISNDAIKVTINAVEHELHKSIFEAREANLVNGRVEYKVVLQIEQYPIILAYALTIHKSQGKTYRRIACDLTDCFAPGQAYVALSRCSSLNGLHLLKSINNRHIAVDSTVREFYLNAH